MTLITEDRIQELIRLCGLTSFGLNAEVGVYKGGSLKLMAEAYPDKTFVGFDTFQGLPKEKWTRNELHSPGDFSDTSLGAVEQFINRGNVFLVQGLFPESATSYDKTKFAFVHIDTDFYLSVKEAIQFFYPKLTPGGIIVLDDFGWPNCPGVEQALSESGLTYIPTHAKYQAYIIKEI